LVSSPRCLRSSSASSSTAFLSTRSTADSSWPLIPFSLSNHHRNLPEYPHQWVKSDYCSKINHCHTSSGVPAQLLAIIVHQLIDLMFLHHQTFMIC
uniref:Ovule protein n=1 Tax=Brugia timori TaxID=42155 RepID=A0A0R3QH55_9BILA